MHKLRNSMVWAVILLLALLPIGRTNGCGISYLRDEYRMVFFNPVLVKDPSMHSLHFFYRIPYFYENADPTQIDYLRNCQEWVDYLGPNVDVQDVHAVLYRTKSDSVFTAIENQLLPEFFPGNTFVKELLLPKRADVLDYLKLIVHSEFTYFAEADPWYLDETLINREKNIRAFLQAAEEKVKTLKDSFLVKRYAYQLVVQSRYLGKSDQCIKYCDQFFPLNRTGSVLMPWAQLHKAEVLDRFDETVYILSRVFDLCESKKYRVHQMVDRSSLAEALKLAQTPHEQATIFALISYNNPGKSFKTLRQVAALDPNSRYLPQLLTREINKLEDWLLTAKMTYFDNPGYHSYWDKTEAVDYMPDEDRGLWMKEIPYLKKNQQKDLLYLRQVRDWVESILTKVVPQQKQFLHLAAAHLYYLDHQAAQAQAHLKQIPRPQNNTIQLQKDLIEPLILPELKDISTLEAKAAIATSFQKIQAHADLLETDLRIYSKLMLYFSRLFHQKGDIVSAGLLHQRGRRIPSNWQEWGSDYYRSIRYFDLFASTQDIDQLIALCQKELPTAFEKLLMAPLNTYEKTEYNSDYWYFYAQEEAKRTKVLPSIEQLYDLKGTIAFRQNRLQEALTAFEQLPENYWQDNYEFADHITHDIFVDVQSLPSRGQRLGNCDKAAIVKKMIHLEKAANHPGPQQAEAAYLLANAYFNVTFWGNAWLMYSYDHSYISTGAPIISWMPDEKEIFHPHSKNFFKVYYELSRAAFYYQKVLQCNPDQELAARATYMLGSCDKYAKLGNDEFIRNNGYDNTQRPYFSPFFHSFRSKFGHTLAYQECLKTCPELADYFKTR